MATGWEADEKTLGVGGRVRAHGQLGFGRNTVGGGGEVRHGTESGGEWELLP